MSKNANKNIKKRSAAEQSRPKTRRVFVLAVAGDGGVEDVHLCLMFLRRFTEDPIYILASRVTLPIRHDRVIHVSAPEYVTTVQMSRYLKTGIQKHVPIEKDTVYCYLDNDVFFLHKNALKMFDYFSGPVTFAYDHKATIRNFSESCLHYGTLDEALDRYFGVRTDPSWRIWNSGVYLFDHTAVDFLNEWNDMTCATFNLPQWKVKDQGPLSAAVWKFGLQHKAVMPSAFNWLVGLSELKGGKGRYKINGFEYRNSDIWAAHFYGGNQSKLRVAWLNAFELVFTKKSFEYRYARRIHNRVRRMRGHKFATLKDALICMSLKPLWVISYAFRQNIPGYAEMLDTFKRKIGMYVPYDDMKAVQIAKAEASIQQALLNVQREMLELSTAKFDTQRLID